LPTSRSSDLPDLSCQITKPLSLRKQLQPLRRSLSNGRSDSWCVELAVKPGQLDNFQALTGEMAEAARREHGVLAYKRFVSADCKLVLLVYGRYADSAAASHGAACSARPSSRARTSGGS